MIATLSMLVMFVASLAWGQYLDSAYVAGETDHLHATLSSVLGKGNRGFRRDAGFFHHRYGFPSVVEDPQNLLRFGIPALNPHGNHPRLVHIGRSHCDCLRSRQRLLASH